MAAILFERNITRKAWKVKMTIFQPVLRRITVSTIASDAAHIGGIGRRWHKSK